MRADGSQFQPTLAGSAACGVCPSAAPNNIAPGLAILEPEAKGKSVIWTLSSFKSFISFVHPLLFALLLIF